MTNDEIATWATAFIEAVKDLGPIKDHSLRWAVDNFGRFTNTSASPRDCWTAVLEILSRNPPSNVIAVLAAGPLEDLIQYHGPEFIELIEAEFRRNQAFRHLLGGVLFGEP